jgi:hypothetical protein
MMGATDSSRQADADEICRSSQGLLLGMPQEVGSITNSGT